MARKHEMVSAKASIPEWMLVGDDADVVDEGTADRGGVMGGRDVDVLNYHDNTEWKEKQKSFLRVCGSERVVFLFHLVYESSL